MTASAADSQLILRTPSLRLPRAWPGDPGLFAVWLAADRWISQAARWTLGSSPRVDAHWRSQWRQVLYMFLTNTSCFAICIAFTHHRGSKPGLACRARWWGGILSGVVVVRWPSTDKGEVGPAWLRPRHNLWFFVHREVGIRASGRG